MQPTTARELIAAVKNENTTVYLGIMNKLQESNVHEASEFSKLSQHQVDQLTPNQMILFKSMNYTRGSQLYFYNYGGSEPSPFAVRYKATNRLSSLNYYGIPEDAITRDDLAYVSKYHQAKWRKENPSRRNAKGTQFTFKPDMFSLTMFKNSIKKRFLRTEAKNLVIAVNKACGNDKTNTKIRNKFYKLILENTDVHTAAMLEHIRNTAITRKGDIPYSVDSDEAICIDVSRYAKDMPYTTSSSMDTYSNDIPLVSHSTFEPKEGVSERYYNRLASAASRLLAMADQTNNTNYTVLATNMLKRLPEQVKKDVLSSTNALVQMNTILKESNE